MNDHPRYTMQYIMKSILIPLVLCMILQDIRTAQATLTNQCTNDDVKNWIDHNYAKFASSMNTCAVKSLSIDSLALKCLKEYMPDATDSCLGCAVGLFNCISAYCVNSCISLSAVQGANYFTTKCLECLRGGNTAQYNCIADSNSCSGWTEDFVFNCETCKQSSDDIFYGIDDNIVWGLIGGIPCFFILVAIISCRYFKRYAKHAELGDQPLPPLKPGETRQPHTAFFNMLPIFHPFSHTVGAPIGPPPGLESIGASSHSFSSSDLNGNKSFIGILDEHSSTSSMMQPQAYMMQSGQLFQQSHIQKQQQKMFVALTPPMMLSPLDAPKSVTKLVATYEFFAQHSDELNVDIGTKLDGIEQIGNWWKCINPATGEVGMIPTSYVMLVPS